MLSIGGKQLTNKETDKKTNRENYTQKTNIKTEIRAIKKIRNEACVLKKINFI